MKKSLLIKISTLALSVCSLLCIGTACKEEHTHSYTETITAPTCTGQGFTTYTCSCGDSYVDCYVDELGHNFIDYNFNGDATCTENGTETATCSRDGCTETDTRTKENSAFNHDYGVVTYTWNENQCTATRVCTRDNTHVETETITAEYIKDTEATCTTAETGHYQATFENVAFETQATNEDTVVNGEPLTHNYSVPTYVWNGYECTATRICGRDSTHIETETVTAVYVKDTDVTCDTPETGHYKATFNNSVFTEQNTAKDSVVNGCALNHSYGTPTYTWNGNKCTAKRVCANDITHVEMETVTAEYVKDTDVTCTEPEKGHYIATFTNSAFVMQTTAKNTVNNGVKLGHNFVDYTYNNDETCEENGTETAICSRDNCTEPHTREKANTKLGHTYGTPVYTWDGNQCTATRICGRDTTHVDTETVTAAYEKDTDATCTTPEEGHYIATFTNSAFTTQTTADNTVENGEELGHSFIDYIYNNNATCTENGTETATCSRDNCDEPYTREKENSALGHDWEKDGTPIVNCTLSGGTQSYKCDRCKATKNEAVTTVLSGAPDKHSSLSVGDVCQHCGKEVLAKNGNSLVMKIDENNYQVEHYAGKAVGFSKYKDYIKSAYISDSVTEIGNDAFYNYSALTSVEIPNSVTKIGNYVFYGCVSLENIIIPDSVTSLGTGVFEGCTGVKTLVLGSGLTEIKEGLLSGCSALESLTIPFVGNNATETTASRASLFGYIFSISAFDGATKTEQYYASDSYETYYIPTSLKSVTVLGGDMLYGAFYNCSALTSITIADSVTSIGEYAFYNCTKLTSIVIPDSVERIGSSAFKGCSSLAEITLPFVGASKDATGYKAVFGYIFGYTTSDSSSISGATYQYYNGPSSSSDQYYYYYIPTSLKKVTITGGTIRDSAFRNCDSLTSVKIGNRVESIGNQAFRNCDSLTSVEIPDSVTSIGSYAFYDCDSLTSIVIPDSVTSIGSYAFKYCSGLPSVEIPDSVTSIGSYAFDNCTSLTKVNYTGTIETWCNISFGNNAANPLFYANNLYLNNVLVTELVIPDSVTSIGSSAFGHCSGLTSVEIPDSVTSIGDSAFYACTKLITVVIPDSVTSIGSSAFRYCSGLTSVEIPDSVTSIGSYAFDNCSSLTKVNYAGTIETWCNISFGNDAANPLFYANNLYLNNELVTELVIPDSVTSIGSYAFDNCSSLTSVEIGDSVTSIGYYAFGNCSSLTEITLPFVGATRNGTSVTHLGYIFGSSRYYNNAEYVPISLKKVTITGGAISNNAFYDCGNLTSVEIGNSVTSIGEWAFAYCSSLTSIKIPDSVTSIDSNAFRNCSSLEEITLPFVGASKDATGYKAVFGYIFGNTTSSSSSTISGTTYQYRSGSTYYHYYIPASLKKVTVTGTTIPDNAFYNCSMIETLICDNVKNIGINALDGCVNLLPYNEYGNAYYWGCQGNEFYALIKAKDTAITYCIINDNTKIIADGAFEGCSALREVEISNSVTSIGNYAFSNCSSLTSIEILDGVTSIGSYAFNGCDSLTSVVIGKGVTSIGSYAFNGCSRLTIYCKAKSRPVGWESYWNYSRPVYWYREKQPTTTGNYWHYDENGNIAVW